VLAEPAAFRRRVVSEEPGTPGNGFFSATNELDPLVRRKS
jgi:hypothetical protein